MTYSVVIRTLGKAGDKYQKTLDSIASQSMKPSAIFVYIADGYEIPKETIGIEQYVYVKKGMVAQRALPYTEVQTEYVLFLDDDVFLPSSGVEDLYRIMTAQGGDVIAPCTFENQMHSWNYKVRLALTGNELFRIRDNRWGFKVMRTAGFSYNNNPKKDVYESQTNAGPCFFCKKSDFIKINFYHEMWLDDTFYALPEDQVMFYKMSRMGLKVLTVYNSGIIHLDASSTIGSLTERTYKIIYSKYRNKLIFWHRFIYLPEKSIIGRVLSVLAIIYVYSIQTLKYLSFYLIGKKQGAKAFYGGIRNALLFLKSGEYKALPRI